MFRAVIAFLLLFAMPAAAGSPQDRPKWWQGQKAKDLGLSTDQSQRIDDIWQAAMPRIRESMQDFENAQRELDKLVAGDRTTETDVVRQLNQVQAYRNEVSRQMTLMSFRFYRELSPDQRQKVKAMFEQRREQERRGGRRNDPPSRQQQTKK